MAALTAYVDEVARVVLDVRDEIKAARAETMRYKGIRAGQAVSYTKGDAVTRDGSLWVCAAPETNEKPGTGDAWQMAHKSDR